MIRRLVRPGVAVKLINRRPFDLIRCQFHSSVSVYNSTALKDKQVDLTPEAVRSAFQPELSAIKTHSLLLNQTSPKDLLELNDVLPMMGLFRGLVANKTGYLAARNVANALKQTAKDSSLALRTLPQQQRIEQKTKLFGELRSLTDEVANSIVEDLFLPDVPFDRPAVNSLFQIYEIVNPYAGVGFYSNMAPSMQAECGAAVIPCMVKSRQPFSDIQRAFEGCSAPDAHAAALMAWACLRYGEVEAAQVLFDDLISQEDEFSPVRKYLLNAFIGDAPADVALETFRKYDRHVPHHAAMSRLITRLWSSEPNVPLQLAVFKEYLERLTMPTELGIKIVANAVVANIFEGSSGPADALSSIQQLCGIYDAYLPRHTVMLNSILSEASKKWGTQADSAKSLILGIIENYEPQDNDSAVSFRVRLNALETLSGVEDLAKDLWTARKSAAQLPRIDKYDWFALARAARGSDLFLKEWKGAGSPFEQHVRRFCASKGYRL